jgi:hypothetical protein
VPRRRSYLQGLAPMTEVISSCQTLRSLETRVGAPPGPAVRGRGELRLVTLLVWSFLMSKIPIARTVPGRKGHQWCTSLRCGLELTVEVFLKILKSTR